MPAGSLSGDPAGTEKVFILNLMRQITYFFAAVYKALERRRTGKDPYHSMVGIITLSCFLILLSIDFLLFFFTRRNILVIGFVGPLIMIFALFYLLFPRKKLDKVLVDQKDEKASLFNFFIGFALALVVLLMVVYKTGK